jgi:hypothetical protein
MKQYRTRGVMDVGSMNNEQFKNRWDKLNLEAKAV